MSEVVVIIRPSFKKFCASDACRAALYNHILFRLARKAKAEPEEKVKKGEIFWYASAEDICKDIDEAWSVNKVRKEIKALVADKLLGQRHNPLKGWDRKFQYFLSPKEGKVLLQKAKETGVCLLHAGLNAEVLHLLHLVNAFDKNGGCICQKEEMHLPYLVNPFTTFGRAIPEESTEESIKTSDTEEGESAAQNALTPAREFAYQIVGHERHYYHEFCVSAQDRGVNDGLTFKISDLSAVPAEAICDICYGKMHEAHKYGVPAVERPVRAEHHLLQEKISDTAARLKAIGAQHEDVEATVKRAAVKIGGTKDGQRIDAALHGVADSNSPARLIGGDLSAGVAGERSPVPALGVAPSATGAQRPAPDAPTAPVASSQTVRGASFPSDGAATSALPLSPLSDGPRASGAVPKRPKAVKPPPEPKGPPVMPAEDAPWTSRTCLQLFDAWRGAYLIGTYKNSQASTCAKGLVEQYSRADVEQAKARMDKDRYYIERGGADVCDVANNIHKYRRKAKPTTAYDGQTDMRTYGFGQNDEAQMEKFRKLGATS